MDNNPTECVVIAEFPKNKKETIRVALTEYQGNRLVDIRAFYPTTEGMKAGKGISIQRSQIVTLRKALQAAERAIKQQTPDSSNPGFPETEESHPEESL